MASRLQLLRGPTPPVSQTTRILLSLQGSPSSALLALQTKPATSLVLRTKAAGSACSPSHTQGSGRPRVHLLCSVGQDRWGSGKQGEEIRMERAASRLEEVGSRAERAEGAESRRQPGSTETMRRKGKRGGRKERSYAGEGERARYTRILPSGKISESKERVGEGSGSLS